MRDHPLINIRNLFRESEIAQGAATGEHFLVNWNFETNCENAIFSMVVPFVISFTSSIDGNYTL